jgi:hypothetical protein
MAIIASMKKAITMILAAGCTRETKTRTYVDGEITNNAKREASSVYISVRWFDKNDKVIAIDLASVSDIAPGETLPFHADTQKNPEIKRYDVTIERVHR